MTDHRLYDIVSALAVNQPTKASETFKTMLGERCEELVRERVRNFQVKGLANGSTNDES